MFGIFYAAEGAISPIPMQNLCDVLSTYYSLRQQKETQLPERLRQVQQQLAAELEALKELEQGFLSAQEKALEEIYPILEVDARSLLPTPQFQEFVRDLVKEVKAKPKKAGYVLSVAPETTKWLLHTLKQPLIFSDIETIEQTNPYGEEDEFITIYGIRMVIQLGKWQQVIDVPTATIQDDDPEMYQKYSPFTQWYEAIVGLKPVAGQLPVAASKRQRLAEELTCMIAYVCDLFNLYSIEERIGFLHRLQE